MEQGEGHMKQGYEAGLKNCHPNYALFGTQGI